MKTILLQVSYAKTLPEKIIGLIGAKKPMTILLKTRFGIHTFGVRFPLDIVILDKNNRVVSLKKSLGINRLFFWNPRYDTVIELPKGMIEEKKVKIGDFIKIMAK